jgi:prepilin-type N-terminal cleavage/methylation domain-containing protein
METKVQKKIFKSISERGFTLIELMVVIAIMALIAGAVIANYAGLRPSRNIRIAQNELVTNIRKVQSYSLSSRNILGNTPVQYYVMKFSTSAPNQYIIEGMYDVKTLPIQLRDVETIKLPDGISLAASTVNAVSSTCMLLAFRLPFADILANTSCVGAPPTVTTGSDYEKLNSFVSNAPSNTVTSDSKIVFTLQDQSGTLTKKVLVNGITGVVCPTQDGTTCQAAY